MVGVAIQRVRPRVGSRMIRTLIADADLLVKANPALFELVLINVLDNAILFSADGTRIVIAATRVGERCRISIADEGCGIPGADSLVCSNASIASAGRRLRPRQRPRTRDRKGLCEGARGIDRGLCSRRR